MVIKINCPNCHKKIDIELDNKQNILSVFINEKQLSSNEQSKILKKMGIEFGCK